MRYVIYSENNISEISKDVSFKLNVIDNGFQFNEELLKD